MEIFGIFQLIRFFVDKIVIHETRISVTRYFHTQTIKWRDIIKIESKRTGYLLKTHEAQVIISSEVINLWKFLRMVNNQCPELLVSKKVTFYENPLAALVMVLAGVWITYYSVTQFVTSSSSLTAKFFTTILGLTFIFIAVLFTRRFSFDENKLIVKTLFKEWSIHPSSINHYFLTQNSLSIFYGKRSHISIDRLIGGLPVFLIPFHNWLSTNSRNNQKDDLDSL